MANEPLLSDLFYLINDLLPPDQRLLIVSPQSTAPA
jgi:hypothetical protein